MKKICFVLGTRPEIIKLAPLLRRFVLQQIPFTLIHTNQHYDHAMDQIFFEELKLPKPHHHLNAAAATPEQFVANVMQGLGKIWETEHPSVVIVQGDTNTVAAAALAAEKSEIPVAHVEAGLRSDDMSMPEEINRILVDHIADRLYAPTEYQVDRLLGESISKDRILLTGNTIADSVGEHLKLSEAVKVPLTLRKLPKAYAIITLHRPALVDQRKLLESALHQIDAALSEAKIRGILLAHPRTKKTLDALKISCKNIAVHKPIGYLPMLKLLQSSSVVLTDSGGLQEEAALLQIPCVTLRTTTERPETIDAGGNILVAPTGTTIKKEITAILKKKISWKPLYNVTHPSDMILTDILSRYT